MTGANAEDDVASMSFEAAMEELKDVADLPSDAGEQLRKITLTESSIIALTCKRQFTPSCVFSI